MKRIVVVGAGISGLALAWRLQTSLDPKVEVHVLESTNRVGGTAWTQRAAGYSLETGPNGFLDTRPAIGQLCVELGLADDRITASPQARHRFIFLDERLRRVPRGPLDLLTTSLLTARGKWRLLREPWSGGAIPTDESIHDFGCRRIGQEATEVLLDAFVTGIFAGDTKTLSMPACLPRIAQLERQHGSLFKAMLHSRKQNQVASRSNDPVPTPARFGRLTTLRGGIGSLVTRLADRLRIPVTMQSQIESLRRKDRAWQLDCPDMVGDVDAVVLACPAPEQARLIQSVDFELATTIRSIPYNAVAVCVLGYPNDVLPTVPTGFGYLAPQRQKRPVLGVIYSSAIFPQQAPTGHFQFRAILGGWQRPDVLDWNDADILQAVRSDLKAALGIDAMPTFDWICRWPRAIPQYHVGHSAKLDWIQNRLQNLPGLFLAGNAYHGVSLDDCVSSSNRLAEQIHQWISNDR